MSVFGSSRFVLLGEEDGEPNVDEEAGEEAEAGNPDTRTVKERVEEFGVFVKSLFTSEDEEVSRKVSCQEEDEGKAG